VIYINTVPHQANFLAPLSGIEEEEAPTSTTFSHVNYAPTLVSPTHRLSIPQFLSFI
jgi:hypothetical protein